MIIGIGVDCCDITRIEDAISRHGDTFLRRLFTENELLEGNSEVNPASYFAKRFAAKEAFVKAMGTGIAEGIEWTEIEIQRNATGAPSVSVVGDTKERLYQRAPIGQQVLIHLSLTDEEPMAIAFVLIEVSGQVS